MLLVVSLCLYSGSVLVTCLIFLLRPTQQTLYIDKVIAYPPDSCARVGSLGSAVTAEGGPGGRSNDGEGREKLLGKTDLGLGEVGGPGRWGRWEELQ